MRTQSTGWRLPNPIIILLSILSIGMGLLGFKLMEVDKFITGLVRPPVEVSEYLLIHTEQSVLPYFNAQTHGDEMLDSEAYEETTTTRQGSAPQTRITAYFGMLTIGNHVLMVKTSDVISESLVDYQGMLMYISDDKAAFEIYNEYLTEVPELNGVLVPMLLDTSRSPTHWAIVYGLMAVLVIIGLAGLMTVWLRLNTETSP